MVHKTPNTSQGHSYYESSIANGKPFVLAMLRIALDRDLSNF